MASESGDAQEDTEHGITPGSADTDGVGPGRGAAVEALPRGAIIGRYVLLHQLGRGGMGVVYSAYDPELDRKIAVKVLHPIAAKTGLAGAVRLVREAQAMARIKHTNVVTVHDVGHEGGVVYVAMEFVEGHTLKRWLRETKRSRAQIVEVFLAAGEGLRAAHDKGLVHRDFKPENVMVEEHGRVVVLDFGVAYAAVADATPMAAEPASSSTALGRADADQTAAGTLIGTPAYMSAEQFAGKVADARADQFAFCVALWEALAGTRPFPGESTPELAVAVTGDHVDEPPRGADIPPWLRRVLVRGLRSDREQRFASMATLLAALRDDPTLRRRRIALAGLAVAVVAAVGATALLARESDRAACTRAGEELAALWNENVRQAIADRMNATHSSYAGEAFAKSMPWLDRWAVEWGTAQADVCVLALEGNDPEYTSAVATCLRERRSAFAEAVAALGETTSDSLQHAVPLAAGLPSVSRCSDRAWLLTRPKPPDDVAIAPVRERLDRAETLAAQGSFDAALSIARTLIDASEADAWPPLRARAQVIIGELLYDTGEYESSRASLVEGFFAATTARDVDLAVRAANGLVLTVGDGLGRFDEAKLWVRLAETQLAAGADPLQRIELLGNQTAVSMVEGRVEQALEQAEAAHASTVEAYGAEHPETVLRRINRAAALGDAGRLREAEEELRACAMDLDRILGAGHPDVGGVHNNLAAILAMSGRLDEAEIQAREAVRVARDSLGARHPNSVTALNTLAAVLESTGRAAEAEEALRAVVDAWTQTFGARHPNVAIARSNLGRAIASQGRLAEAKAEFVDAIEVAVSEVGENHPTVGGLREELAAVLQREGLREESLAEYRKVLAIRRSILPADHPDIAFAGTNLGRALLAVGKRDEARAELEQAWALLHRVDAQPDELATTGWWLAQTLPEGARALAVAREALRAFTDAGDTEQASKVAEWLAARSAAPADTTSK